ncbi:hypothetical protein G9H72_13920 [Motilibacter sp. K478]|nr:hypothetical protein [Motilibacter aurantiacus]NHC46348.1 hypothetical protein [Motilibacter aurantiacus]
MAGSSRAARFTKNVMRSSRSPAWETMKPLTRKKSSSPAWPPFWWSTCRVSTKSSRYADQGFQITPPWVAVHSPMTWASSTSTTAIARAACTPGT